MKPPRLALCVASLGVLALGCYAGTARDVSVRQAAAFASDPRWTFAPDVAFVPQQSDSDCGPAALTMMLGHFGIRATLADVSASSPPDDGGVRARALRDVARSKGLAAFVVPGTFEDLVAELRHGRPILVGLAKPITGGRALAHYEVVVGLDSKDRQILTLDPGRGARVNTLEGFAREWSPTGRVTIIMRRPPTG
jgi:ABC-type bacteriocin/lantibiotic exporter with double-glycine peptidase domain